MNWKTLFAVSLAILMVIPVVPVAIPAAAATGGVVVPPVVVGPGAPVAFYVNLTYLRTTLGWIGSQVELYWSDNGFATLTSGVNIPVQLIENGVPTTAIYTADVDYVAGTIIAPSGTDLATLLHNASSGYIYLKVSDGNNIAVSARILIVADTKQYLTVNAEKLAFAYGPLGTTNYFEFTANLTELNSILAPEGNQIWFNETTMNYTVNILLISPSGFTYTAASANVSNNTVTAGPFSDVFTLDWFNATTNGTTGETVVFFNGTLKDFPLSQSMGTGSDTFKGITDIHYVPFSLSFQVLGNQTILLNGPTRVIDNNVVSSGSVTTYMLPDMRVTLGYPDTIDIYPSVEYIGFTDNVSANTPTGQVNPNDLITLTLHNYPANSNIVLVRIFRYDMATDSFSSFDLVNLTGVFTTAADGSATITFRLPEDPYGGLKYAFVVCVADAYGVMRGMPTTNTTGNSVLLLPIAPYVEAFAATDDGTFRLTLAGPTAPGDYILVKGHGFLQEPINLTANLASNLASVLFDVEELASYGLVGGIQVFSNGTFIAVAKIPSTAWTNQSFKIVANGATATDTGFHVGNFTFDLGNNIDGVQKVYVNPTPVIVNATYAYIALGLSPAYPYPATWEDEMYREFTVEVIGLDPVSFSMVTVNLTDGVYSSTLAVNQTPVNGYLLFENVPVPVVPYGDYSIKVFNVTAPTIYEMSAFPQVNVTPTAALQDPLTGDWMKTVTLIGVTDVNVTGYGWPANAPMEWDINELAMLGYVNFTIKTLDKTAQAYTNASGAFIGLLEVSLYISTPGMYHLTIHPTGSSLSDVVALNIGVAPSLVAIVDTGKTKVTGDYVDVWVLVKFSNEELATPDKVSEVRVFVYAYTDAGMISVNSPAGELATYTGIPGLWHYTFYLNPSLKGEDLAIFVTAKGQYLPYLPVQEAHDLAALTVSGELVNMLDDLGNKLASINDTVTSISSTVSDISGKLDDVTSTLGTIKNDVRDLSTAVNGLQTTLGTISTDLGNLQNSVNDLSGKVDSAKGEILNAISKLGADTKDGISQVGSGVKNFGIASVVLLIILLALVGYGFFARKG